MITICPTGLLEIERAKKIDDVNATRDELANVPMLRTINGVEKYFKINILDWNTHALTMKDGEFIEWYPIDNQPTLINKDDILNLCDHIRSRRSTLVAHGVAIKSQLRAATTLVELNAVNTSFV